MMHFYTADHTGNKLLPRLNAHGKRKSASNFRVEYYAFGLQTANSWTRDNTTANNFLANGGTELNTTSSLYDLEFRNYDPILGRMNQVDPMASRYASYTPYNYSFNSPVVWNDVNGADPNPGEPDHVTRRGYSLLEWFNPSTTMLMGMSSNTDYGLFDMNFAGGWFNVGGIANGNQELSDYYSMNTGNFESKYNSNVTLFDASNGGKVGELTSKGFWIDYESTSGSRINGTGDNGDPNDLKGGKRMDDLSISFQKSRWVSLDELANGKQPSTIWNIDAGLMAGFNLWGSLKAELNVVSVGLWTNDPQKKDIGKVTVKNSLGLGAKINGIGAGIDVGQEQQIKTSSLYSDPNDYYKTFSANFLNNNFGGKTGVDGKTNTTLDNSFSIDLIFIKITATTPFTQPK